MKKIILSLLAIAVLTGCKKDDEETTTTSTGGTNASYTVPTTYNFDNVSYGGQTDRLNMLAALTSYVKTGHTEGTTLDASVLNAMYANDGYTWDATVFPTQPTKDLKSKTYQYTQASIVTLFDSIVAHSGKAGGANGQAGLVVRGDGHILVNANGMEYSQLIDKGLMGSCFYYQGTSKYLSDAKIGDEVDNVTVTPGEGTDKEHHFDEAFGYFGVPIDFPTNTDGLLFWGKYCNKRDKVAGTNDIMDAFIKGRKAISAKNKADQDAAVLDIKLKWEKVAAATAIHYLNAGVESFDDAGERLHVLTEAYAFIGAFGYNSEGSISLDDGNEVLALLGDNFWTVTKAKIEAARDLLAVKAGLESVKTEL